MDTSWIDGSGRIIESRIAGKEPLYKGMNGKSVERVFLSTNESCIFKPLTNDSQSGTEAWVYAHVLPSLRPVYPKLLACSPEGADPDHSWTIFEDLGTLRHVFDLQTALNLMGHIVHWHSVVVSDPAFLRLRGPKPDADAVAAELLADRSQWNELAGINFQLLNHNLIDRVLGILEKEGQQLLMTKPRVLSHGDLHLGNYTAANGGGVKVIDWEHAHPNSPYWDLYHAIDMSHPVFPKAMTDDAREQLLGAYIAETNSLPPMSNPSIQDRTLFKRGYYLFAAIYSLWMLRLIAKDIAADAGIWPLEQLRRQLGETSASFLQCAERL